DAVDYDLSLPQRQVALVEQACAHEAREETLVAGEYAKEHERRDTCGQQRIEPRLDLGGVGRGRGGDAGGLGHATSFCAIVFIADIGPHATEKKAWHRATPAACADRPVAGRSWCCSTCSAAA